MLIRDNHGDVIGAVVSHGDTQERDEELAGHTASVPRDLRTDGTARIWHESAVEKLKKA